MQLAVLPDALRAPLPVLSQLGGHLVPLWAGEAAVGRERLKAAEKGRCRARLEKRVRAERRKRRKAAGEGADKSGEREAGFLNNLFLQWPLKNFC